MCVCGLSYPEQRACAILYCHLSPVWLYSIFPHYLTHGMDFGRKLLNTKYAFLFSLKLLYETSIILRGIQRGIIINVHRSCKVLLFLSNCNETSIFSIDFRKILKYQILRKSVQWEPSCLCGWTDGQADRETW